MANEIIKAAIAEVIKNNENREITGNILQYWLWAIVDAVGTNAQFKGLAIPATTPVTNDLNVFYFASTVGTYTNFSGLSVAANEYCILEWNGTAWSKTVLLDLSSYVNPATPALVDLADIEGSPSNGGIPTWSEALQKFQFSPFAIPSGTPMGVATPTTNPGTPTDPVWYFASEAGTYTNFDEIEISGETVCLLAWDESWSKVETNIANFKNLKKILTFFLQSYDFTIAGFMRPVGTLSTSASYLRTDYIDISGVISTFYITTTPGSLSVSPIVFFDESLNYISGVTPSAVTEIYVEVAKPSNAKYAVLSIVNTKPALSSCRTDVDITPQRKEKCYISVTGDDDNDGSYEHPILTFRKAKQLLIETGELSFLEGDYTNFSFDISTFSKVTGIGNVRFIGGIPITAATLESGYTRVYKCTYTPSIATSSFLWQHDIEDEETVIDVNERHPFHRGKRTRLSSTRIYYASSIAEIEATTDKLMWYKSGSTLYFSITAGSDISVNPIIIPSGTYYGKERKNIEINNIQSLYTNVVLTNVSGALIDVSCGYVNKDGAFILNYCVGLTLKKCEAFAASNDGINGHTALGGRTSVVFENCYGHDNSDDGESCHEYCDVIERGSLYEYNGSGVTPATGGHAACYDVVCRKNGGHAWAVTYADSGSGFSAQGAATEGIGTNIWCHNCISIENSRIGFDGLDNSSKYINCVSIDDVVAFGTGEAINCTTV